MLSGSLATDLHLGRNGDLAVFSKGRGSGKDPGESFRYNTVMWIVFGIILVLLTIWICQGLRMDLQISRYTFFHPAIPQGQDPIVIVQLSDLHSSRVKGLLKGVEEAQPDLIVCTGDMFDGVRKQEEAFVLICALQQIAPVFYVSGNHEKYLPVWPLRKEELEEEGITFLENRSVLWKPDCQPVPIVQDGSMDERLEEEEGWLEIAGLADPQQDVHEPWAAKLARFHTSIKELPPKKPLRLLLCHRPQLFDDMPDELADFVLSGHVHGGQWRFFNQGLAGPGTKHRLEFLPFYDAGIFYKKKMWLLVSRGLGDQMKFPRFYNRPQLNVIELRNGPKADMIEHYT